MASPATSSSAAAAAAVSASDDAAASTARAFVVQHLGDTLAAFPAAVRDALVDKFVADYNAPLTAQLECVVRKRLTDDEVRHLQFAPTPAQHCFYADLLSLRAPWGEAEDPTSWQFVARKRFLTLFYIKHARNWPLVVDFVLRDGLQILVDLFLHDDLQMRGQAIDSFVQITSNAGAFEWFDAPVGYEARVLHAKMIALATPEAGFLSKMIANIRLYDEPDHGGDGDRTTQRLPGGTLVLLQLLAFFLSWVRKLYTRNELRLSRELLALLRDWGRRTRCDNDDELRLAQQVYEDFNRWPAIEDACDAQETKQQDEQPTTTTATNAPHIALTGGSDLGSSDGVFSRATVAELIRLADSNDGYDDTVERVIALCSEAIDAKLNATDALLCRAQTRLQQIQRANDRRRNAALADASVIEGAQLCLRDCSVVLEREPGNMAAWKCQLGLLETMGMWSEAHDVLDAWHARDEAGTGVFYVPEDLAYLTERRGFFDDKVHEARQREAATATRQHATRKAKEQHVYHLLLQRSERQLGIFATLPRHERDGSSETKAKTLEETTPPIAAREKDHDKSQRSAVPRDVLARFRSSTTEKNKKKALLNNAAASTADAPLGGVLKAASRAFVRKLSQCKRDALAIRKLLLVSRVQDVNAAVETALPEESLACVLAALVMEPDDDEDGADEALLSMLNHLISLRRFELMRAMAAPAQQRQLNEAVRRAHNLLGTAWAA